MKLVFVHALLHLHGFLERGRLGGKPRNGKNGKRSETSPSRDLGAAGPDHTILSQLRAGILLVKNAMEVRD